MLLITPFVPGLTNYETYAADLKKRGSLVNHVHRVISRVEDEEEAYRFGTDLADLFLKSSFQGLPPAERTKSQLSNELFRAAARFAASYKAGEGEVPDPAALYMDPAFRPQKNGWLDSIQAEYYLKQAPPVFAAKTKANDEGAKIFLGPLVVSKTFAGSSALLDFIPANQHWRNYLRWELTKDAQETDLIGTGSAESVLKQPPAKK